MDEISEINKELTKLSHMFEEYKKAAIKKITHIIDKAKSVDRDSIYDISTLLINHNNEVHIYGSTITSMNLELLGMSNKQVVKENIVVVPPKEKEICITYTVNVSSNEKVNLSIPIKEPNEVTPSTFYYSNKEKMIYVPIMIKTADGKEHRINIQSQWGKLVFDPKQIYKTNRCMHADQCPRMREYGCGYFHKGSEYTKKAAIDKYYDLSLVQRHYNPKLFIYGIDDYNKENYDPSRYPRIGCIDKLERDMTNSDITSWDNFTAFTGYNILLSALISIIEPKFTGNL